jgi:hypothetical protein
MKRIALALIVVLLLALPGAAAAVGPEHPHRPVGLKILDAAVVRPLAMVGSIGSTALCLGIMPITFPIGLARDTVPYMIVAPWRFTHNRYLGDFRNYEDGGTATGFGIRD